IRTLQEKELLDDRSKEVEIPWKEGGIYLITGGAGGLGFVFAEEIARKIKGVTLILTGRSELSKNKQLRLKALQEVGANVEYRRSDIAEKDQVKVLIEEIRETFGGLHGIIHSAGVIRDNVIIHKTEEEFSEVMKPKVSGLLNIDEYTRDLVLDFIILFSSGAGAFGNPGQADYATANAFMDMYAGYRNKLVEKGVRCGKTLSINWPLWANGGMHVDKEIEKILFENLGMIPMKTKTGINALYKALAEQNDQIMIMEGDKEKIKKSILSSESKEELSQQIESMEEVNLEIVKDKVIQKLTVLFGESMKLGVDKIDTEESFQSYGVDSIKLTSLNQKIASHFKEVSNTVFFEYSTISDLGGYLVSEYPNDCLKWIEYGKEKGKEDTPISNLCLNSTNIFPKLSSKKDLLEPIGWKKGNLGNNNKDNEPIAVIGVSGRFPMAKNLDEFWQNLKKGKNCISEIPEKRWPLNDFYSPNREEAIADGKSFSKWGGFLDGFSNFDPLFFNISPAEAERMDPQERIFLEECWKAIEDAGYVPSKIEEGLRRYIGVFGGITKTGFSLWNNASNKFFNTSFSSLVNRVSYFMDFRGPSVAVDSMCSSSLVALHRACESIRHGEINMAVVGAVNLYLHPSNYQALTQAGLLSDSSRSSVFGKGGNGFIPSEGVGAVVLKRLSDAEKDNDHIWAVIKGSAVTHSGKTNGYNIPDPAKQADVIQEALNVSNIDPRSIGHIEVAASGSEMVDSIEMTAISKVFNKFRNQDSNFYTMSSIKSVLGHGEAVSGMSQFIKALLQLKYKVLCPTLLPEQLNPNIKFNSLPFRIETNLLEWSQLNIDGIRSPRRIGINNFGAGGVYGHLILEEYEKPKYPSNGIPSNGTSNLFVFSAKTNHSLRRYLKVWKEYFEKNPEVDLKQLAYILQIKREAMKKRFATIAQDTQELINNIEDYLKDTPNRNVYTENVNNGYHSKQKLQNSMFEQKVDKLISENDFSGLAEIWINGASLNWTKLNKNYAPENIPQLPTYPFRQKEFWVNVNEDSYLEKSLNKDFISLDAILGEQLEDTRQDINLPVKDVTETNIGFVPLPSYSHTEDANNNQLNKSNVDELPETIEIQQVIKEILYEILYLDDLDEFDIQANFREIGLDSISISKFIQKANTKLGINIKETVIFDYPNTVQLANYITSQLVKL
ncbi:SDR family NAD(P)-dependent oxidoreductase, partial [Bacillus cereus]|uniref:SDR family NAD(P)-dependent oxidoreductase n=1 Tax=Bacillus cereus TaxID=1396 RepID=UPI000BFACD8D